MDAESRPWTALSGARAQAPIALVLAALLFPPAATAQSILAEVRGPEVEGTVERVTLESGTVYFGRVLDDGDPLRLELRNGEVVEIARREIGKLETVRGSFEAGEFWPADANETRLFFAPTGRNHRRGGGSFNAYYGILPFIALGVTDRLALAGGTPLFISPGDETLLYGTAKYQIIRTSAAQLGIGLLALHVTGGGDDSAYLAYGVATWQASRHAGITAGAGWGRAEDGWSSTPALVLGADLRGSPRLKLITENYLFPSGTGLLSAGVRFMGERLSADLALATPVASGDFVAFPLVNFSYGW